MKKLRCVKRNGNVVDFDKKKIVIAIEKAMKNGSGIYKDGLAEEIADEIEVLANISEKDFSIQKIEDLVFSKLVDKGQAVTAKAYEGYRAVQEFKRLENTTDARVIGLIDGSNKEDLTENSNKQEALVSTQRDLVAEVISKDIAKRKMLPAHITQAHDEGQIHIHDLGYYVNSSFNCFTGDTRFITDRGVMRFDECRDGQVVNVVDKDGHWRKATVRSYGKQEIQNIRLSSGRTVRNIRCTKDHRWILKDGTVTTKIKIGDKLHLLNETKNSDISDYHSFCLGFVLGDGNDFSKGENHNGARVRLCGDKIKHLDKFIKCGYNVSSYKFENKDDVILNKNGFKIKGAFLESKGWKYLPKDSLVDLFRGYYEADGFKDRNGIATSDPRLAEMIRDISALAGYHITSEKFEVRNTNLKSGSELYTFRFMRSQPPTRNWIVKDITTPSRDKAPRLVWCVEEPITQSFTLDGGIVTGNCCLLNLKDMLMNGTVINGKMIESPKSFRTACTVATQIIAQVASGQFGGQTISLAHLAPFVRISEDKIRSRTTHKWDAIGLMYDKSQLDKSVAIDLKKEVADGIQTLQYQINTLN